jgi:hypothetical protein
MTNPVFIITIHGSEQPRFVSFKELFDLKNVITSMAMLWVNNCYYVNIGMKYFIINGGIKQTFSTPVNETFSIFYKRRNTQKIGDEKSTRSSYLLGVEYESGKTYIHISDDGKFWAWNKGE